MEQLLSERLTTQRTFRLKVMVRRISGLQQMQFVGQLAQCRTDLAGQACRRRRCRHCLVLVGLAEAI